MSETMERSASIPRRFVKLTPMRAEMARVMRVSIQLKIERQKNPDQLAVIEPVKQRSADVTDEDVVRHDRDRQRDRVHLKEFLRRERRLIPGLFATGSPRMQTAS